jgi:hypothetical protein
MKLMKLHVVAFIIACTAAVAASAQTSPPQRLLISAGLGEGSGWPSCSACTGIDHREGPTGYARVGTFVRYNVALSVEYNRWINNSTDINSQFQNVLGVLQVYAPPLPGLFLRVGAGAGGTILKFNDGSGLNISSTGFSYGAGLGYDFPVAGHFAVSPFADFIATSGATEQVNLGGASGSLDADVVRFGVGLTWK